MRRHFLEIVSTLRILDSDGNEIEKGSIEAKVAVDIQGSGLHEIIDQTSVEVAQDIASNAKRIFDARASDLKK